MCVHLLLCVWCVECVCKPWKCMCVFCLQREQKREKMCDGSLPHYLKKIIIKRVDSANSVSVCRQITNKCCTLLNRPLAIIGRPTHHFQNLWRFPIYLALNPCHVTNRFVTGNDLLSQGHMKWSWPLSDRQELNWQTCPGPRHLSPLLSAPSRWIKKKKERKKKLKFRVLHSRLVQVLFPQVLNEPEVNTVAK